MNKLGPAPGQEFWTDVMGTDCSGVFGTHRCVCASEQRNCGVRQGGGAHSRTPALVSWREGRALAASGVYVCVNAAGV